MLDFVTIGSLCVENSTFVVLKRLSWGVAGESNDIRLQIVANC